MRKIAISFLLLIVFSLINFAWLSSSKTVKRTIFFHSPKFTTYKAPLAEFSKLQSKASIAKAFVKENRFDTLICFLIDMSLPANHKRLFVYDLEKGRIQNSGLVAHGNCNQYWLEGRKYGNEWAAVVHHLANTGLATLIMESLA